jgi:hypothetical protein
MDFTSTMRERLWITRCCFLERLEVVLGALLLEIHTSRARRSKTVNAGRLIQIPQVNIIHAPRLLRSVLDTLKHWLTMIETQQDQSSLLLRIPSLVPYESTHLRHCLMAPLRTGPAFVHRVARQSFSFSLMTRRLPGLRVTKMRPVSRRLPTSLCRRCRCEGWNIEIPIQSMTLLIWTKEPTRRCGPTTL